MNVSIYLCIKIYIFIYLYIYISICVHVSHSVCIFYLGLSENDVSPKNLLVNHPFSSKTTRPAGCFWPNSDRPRGYKPRHSSGLGKQYCWLGLVGGEVKPNWQGTHWFPSWPFTSRWKRPGCSIWRCPKRGYPNSWMVYDGKSETCSTDWFRKTSQETLVFTIQMCLFL